MIIAVDYDGTVVDSDGISYDSESPPPLMHGAREGLMALKRAGHTLVLYSARSNRALRVDPSLDPLVRAGKRKVDRAAWEEARPIHEARYQQMVDHVNRVLSGVFDAIDDGLQGKPAAQLYIDNNALRFGASLRGAGWNRIAAEYGAPARAALRGRP